VKARRGVERHGISDNVAIGRIVVTGDDGSLLLPGVLVKVIFLTVVPPVIVTGAPSRRPSSASAKKLIGTKTVPSSLGVCGIDSQQDVSMPANADPSRTLPLCCKNLMKHSKKEEIKG